MVKITWQSGTGNDFFVSLYVLNHAGEFGLRPSWAAGVRSRLPADQRDFLEQSQRFLRVPLTWLASLPQAKRDAKDVLSELGVLAPAKRLEVLMLPYDTSFELRETLAGISARGGWTAADLDLIRAFPYPPLYPASQRGPERFVQCLEPARGIRRTLPGGALYLLPGILFRRRRAHPSLVAGWIGKSAKDGCWNGARPAG